MDDIIKIVESGLLIDNATETVKHEIKNQEGGFLGPVLAPMTALVIFSLIKPVAPLLINAITGKWVRGAGKRQEGKILSLLTLPLMIKILGKGVRRAGRGNNNINEIS